MNQEHEKMAREIFAHHQKHWSPDETTFLLAMFKLGHRAKLKKILAEYQHA